MALFSLQKDASPEALGALPQAADLAPLLDDFAATAYAVSRLDLIVTADTALAQPAVCKRGVVGAALRRSLA